MGNGERSPLKVVADEDGTDWREIGASDARRSVAFQFGPGGWPIGNRPQVGNVPRGTAGVCHTGVGFNDTALNLLIARHIVGIHDIGLLHFAAAPLLS
jgi:hypothetical protein